MKAHIDSASAAGLAWVKSSYSGNNSNCVEAAALPDGARATRDSKDPHGPALVFAGGEWNAFLKWVKSSYSGNNGDCVEVASLPGGARATRDSKDPHGPALVFPGAEWSAFLAAVIAGEFPAK